MNRVVRIITILVFLISCFWIQPAQARRGLLRSRGRVRMPNRSLSSDRQPKTATSSDSSRPEKDSPPSNTKWLAGSSPQRPVYPKIGPVKAVHVRPKDKKSAGWTLYAVKTKDGYPLYRIKNEEKGVVSGDGKGPNRITVSDNELDVWIMSDDNKWVRPKREDGSYGKYGPKEIQYYLDYNREAGSILVNSQLDLEKELIAKALGVKAKDLDLSAAKEAIAALGRAGEDVFESGQKALTNIATSGLDQLTNSLGSFGNELKEGHAAYSEETKMLAKAGSAIFGSQQQGLSDLVTTALSGVGLGPTKIITEIAQWGDGFREGDIKAVAGLVDWQGEVFSPLETITQVGEVILKPLESLGSMVTSGKDQLAGLADDFRNFGDRLNDSQIAYSQQAQELAQAGAAIFDSQQQRIYDLAIPSEGITAVVTTQRWFKGITAAESSIFTNPDIVPSIFNQKLVASFESGGKELLKPFQNGFDSLERIVSISSQATDYLAQNLKQQIEAENPNGVRLAEIYKFGGNPKVYAVDEWRKVDWGSETGPEAYTGRNMRENKPDSIIAYRDNSGEFNMSSVRAYSDNVQWLPREHFSRIAESQKKMADSLAQQSIASNQLASRLAPSIKKPEPFRPEKYVFRYEAQFYRLMEQAAAQGKINLNKEYFFLNPYPYRQAWTHVFSKLIDQPLKGLNFEQHGLVVRELAAQRSELSTTTDIERRLWKTTVFALEHRTERALIEAALMSRKMSANIPLLNKKSVKAIAENE